jgi:hypothetical protein
MMPQEPDSRPFTSCCQVPDISLLCGCPQTESRLSIPQAFAYLSTAAAPAMRVIELADAAVVVAIRA